MSPSKPPSEDAQENSSLAQVGFAHEPLLFEVAWEVCRQVGGIYTVLRSKVPEMIRRWGSRYFLIGPYDPDGSPAEFEESRPTGRIAEVLKDLHERGLKARFGTWLITGRPKVVLLEHASAYDKLDQIKYLLWKHHHISSPAGDKLYDDVLCFGYMVEQFLTAYMQHPSRRRPVIAHFHEWMAATAIPVLRRLELPLSIVFTTHATMLGRFLAMNDPWFYDHLPFVNWEDDARRFNIYAHVQLERAAAHGAHVFTTLSEITDYECQHLLGRKADILLPNGVNIERFTAIHEFQNLHRLYKQRINKFVMAHFFPSYTFDLDRTLYFVGSGRYEYRNKGFDLTIDALAKLNHRLKQTPTDRTIVFFLVTKRPFRSIHPDVLNRRAVMEEIRSTCDAMKDQFGQNLFLATAMGQTPRYEDLVDDYWRLRLRRVVQAWKSRNLPSIVTHILEDDSRDEVLNQLRACGLVNRPEDPVKVVYHPDFVSFTDALFGMDYDQFVRGCHLGIFPSYYEPWGYTPLECVARGVPAVTSDLAGFGTYLTKNMPDYGGRGMYVVHRRHRSFDESSRELAEWLYGFCRLERRDRIDLRNKAESSSDQFDWGHLLDNYDKAYEMVREVTKKE